MKEMKKYQKKLIRNNKMLKMANLLLRKSQAKK